MALNRRPPSANSSQFTDFNFQKGGKFYEIQSIMDTEYKEFFLETLKTGNEPMAKLMCDRFPGHQWIFQIETQKRPVIQPSDSWPSQYICVCKDKTYFVCYRVVDFDDKAREITEKFLMLEKKLHLTEQMTQ